LLVLLPVCLCLLVHDTKNCARACHRPPLDQRSTNTDQHTHTHAHTHNARTHTHPHEGLVNTNVFKRFIKKVPPCSETPAADRLCSLFLKKQVRLPSGKRKCIWKRFTGTATTK
jgi:hypothetical protein